MEFTNTAEVMPSKDATLKKCHSLESHYSKKFAPLMNKKKEPKFVPYEPYKAAVSPIISNSKKSENVSTPVVIDSQKVTSLASSIIQYSKKELDACEKVRNSSSEINDCELKNVCGQQCNEKIKQLEEKISQLEKEKKSLESQFKVQTDVSSHIFSVCFHNLE